MTCSSVIYTCRYHDNLEAGTTETGITMGRPTVHWWWAPTGVPAIKTPSDNNEFGPHPVVMIGRRQQAELHGCTQYSCRQINGTPLQGKSVTPGCT